LLIRYHAVMTVDEIATQAIALDDLAEREDYLVRACGDDESLRKKVDSLLMALESADEASFLSSGFFGSGKSSPAETQERGGEEQTVEEQRGSASGQRFEARTKHAIGGLGEVWLAWDRELGREVALKQMRPEWSSNVDAAARFRREAEITGYLEHPGIVPIYALGNQPDGRPFYAMQFIRGRTLEQVVGETIGTPPAGDALSASDAAAKTSHPWYDTASLRKMLDHFVDICQTIDYAHSKHVVHRDLKPANIMLGSYGQTLVVDWGLAKKIDPAFGQASGHQFFDIVNESLDATLSMMTQNDSSVDETQQGTAMGTPRYMSPEQAAGKIDEIGPPADIYCLGATLYFILAGQAPHIGQADLKSTFQRIVSGQFDPPSKVRAEIPRPLQAIVMKSMRTSAADRYASAGQLAEDVQKYLADQPVSVFEDPPIEKILRWTRNHRALTAALAVGLLLTFIGSISGLLVRQEMDRRATEAARKEEVKNREIVFQEKTRRLEAVAASDAAINRSEAAIAESRYADAAALIGVAIDRLENQSTLATRRQRLIEKRESLRRLGRFDSLHNAGEDLDHLTRDTEAAILLQESLDQLGVWGSDNWWNDLPDDDLSAVQKDRLRWQVYRILTALNSLYLTKMVAAMGGESAGGTPSPFQMMRSYVSTKRGTREALATVELTKRIQSFRTSEAARWLGSIAAFRLNGGSRVEPRELGPPRNPADGQSLAIFSMIASVDPAYRVWFSGYGETFLENGDQDPSIRPLNVAIESLRRVSDQAPDDYWIRLTLAQCYFLVAQNAESRDDFNDAIEHYELARSEYGRCIAIRPGAAFGFADRSTVALRQAVLMRDHPDATDGQRRRARELLQRSLRDASHAKRLTPASHWVYWHVGATAAELGQTDAAIDAFFTAVELGFDVQQTMDAPVIRLDDHRGRRHAIEFAYRDSERIAEPIGVDVASSRLASLIASLEYSRGRTDAAREWSGKAVALDPENARASQIAGWCAFHDASWEQAQRHFETAIRLSPQDPVSLIGAARVAEREECLDLQLSDRLYRRAIEVAVSERHRSTAWFGLAKQALLRGQLAEALSAIDSARRLDPACDVSQFIDLARSEARRLLLLAKSAKAPSEKEDAMGQIAKLKTFLDDISALPIASVNQIVQSASDRPPTMLPVLGGDFELPLETYWMLSSAGELDAPSGVTFGGSPPLAITARTGDEGGSILTVKRAEANRATAAWHLKQVVPATTGQSYRLSASSRSIDTDSDSVVIAIRYADSDRIQLPLSTAEDHWVNCQSDFSLPIGQSPIEPIEIRIEVNDPGKGTVMVDDVKITLIESQLIEEQ
jgi:serine/threonine protein kinase